MTIEDLKRIIEEAEEAGLTDESKVMIATQPSYPLVSNLARSSAVIEPDENLYAPGTDCTPYLILCEGGQRYDSPYLNEEESDALEQWAHR